MLKVRRHSSFNIYVLKLSLALLDLLEKAGIIHRDISIWNLMLEADPYLLEELQSILRRRGLLVDLDYAREMLKLHFEIEDIGDSDNNDDACYSDSDNTSIISGNLQDPFQSTAVQPAAQNTMDVSEESNETTALPTLWSHYSNVSFQNPALLDLVAEPTESNASEGTEVEALKYADMDEAKKLKYRQQRGHRTVCFLLELFRLSFLLTFY